MILQRDMPTEVWGTGAAGGAEVKVTAGADVEVYDRVKRVATTTASANGDWTATLLNIPATMSTTLAVNDGTSSTKLTDVAFGDVIVCGGQSNMGFGMCGTRSKNQTYQQALGALEPIRFYFQVINTPHPPQINLENAHHQLVRRQAVGPVVGAVAKAAQPVTAESPSHSH
jgi:sialate O-acetylesterase